MKLNSKQLRATQYVSQETLDLVSTTRIPLYLIVCDVVDTYNVGSFFRLADALGVASMFLTGKTECPPNPRIEKASIGTHRWVDWSYKSDTVGAITELRKNVPNISICAIEQSLGSVSFCEIKFSLPLAVVLGNESSGLPEQVCQSCDMIVEIPMKGVNRSLNVVVSAAMVLGQLHEAFT